LKTHDGKELSLAGSKFDAVHTFADFGASIFATIFGYFAGNKFIRYLNLTKDFENL